MTEKRDSIAAMWMRAPQETISVMVQNPQLSARFRRERICGVAWLGCGPSNPGLSKRPDRSRLHVEAQFSQPDKLKSNKPVIDRWISTYQVRYRA